MSHASSEDFDFNLDDFLNSPTFRDSLEPDLMHISLPQSKFYFDILLTCIKMRTL